MSQMLWNLSLLCVSVCLQWRWQTSLQFVRFRKRINIQRPAAPHYERAKVLKVCKPYYLNPREGMSLADLCEKPIEVQPRKEDVVGFFLLIIFNPRPKAVFPKSFSPWESFCLKKYWQNTTLKQNQKFINYTKMKTLNSD